MTLVSALCAGMLAGCGGGSSASTGSTGDSGSTASGDAYNVTVIVKHTDGHFNKVIAGARAYGSEHDNVNVEIQSPTSATSYDEQVNMIETALGNPGIDAVIIAPQQSTSTATLVDTATKPVVALDTDFTSDKKACFVGTGNEDAALNGGKAVAPLKQIGTCDPDKHGSLVRFKADSTIFTETVAYNHDVLYDRLRQIRGDNYRKHQNTRRQMPEIRFGIAHQPGKVFGILIFISLLIIPHQIFPLCSGCWLISSSSSCFS